MSSPKKQHSLADAFSYAATGIITTVREERNIKIELLCALLALIVSAVLQLEPVEWAIIVLFIALVLALELANSALEHSIDLVCPEHNPHAKKAKDAMAGAVLLTALAAAIGGLIIFIQAALRLFG